MTEPQANLFDQPRDGDTIEADRDELRLNAQHRRIYAVVKDEDWRTLAQIAHETGDPEASVSARLRDFRKQRFGSHTVERRHVEDGLHEYRLRWNPTTPRPDSEPVPTEADKLAAADRRLRNRRYP